LILPERTENESLILHRCVMFFTIFLVIPIGCIYHKVVVWGFTIANWITVNLPIAQVDQNYRYVDAITKILEFQKLKFMC